MKGGIPNAPPDTQWCNKNNPPVSCYQNNTPYNSSTVEDSFSLGESWCWKRRPNIIVEHLLNFHSNPYFTLYKPPNHCCVLEPLSTSSPYQYVYYEPRLVSNVTSNGGKVLPSLRTSDSSRSLSNEPRVDSPWQTWAFWSYHPTSIATNMSTEPC